MFVLTTAWSSFAEDVALRMNEAALKKVSQWRDALERATTFDSWGQVCLWSIGTLGTCIGQGSNDL